MRDNWEDQERGDWNLERMQAEFQERLHGKPSDDEQCRTAAAKVIQAAVRWRHARIDPAGALLELHDAVVAWEELPRSNR